MLGKKIQGCVTEIFTNHSRDPEGKLPYIVAESKAIRNEFRYFRSDYPERYNYDLAQVLKSWHKKILNDLLILVALCYWCMLQLYINVISNCRLQLWVQT